MRRSRPSASPARTADETDRGESETWLLQWGDDLSQAVVVPALHALPDVHPTAP